MEVSSPEPSRAASFDTRNFDTRNVMIKNKPILIQEVRSRQRVVKAISDSYVDVLMRVRGVDKLVPAFTDSGCIGLDTCPEWLFNIYFSKEATSIRAAAPAYDYQGNAIPTLGEFDILLEDLLGFKTRKPLGKKNKKVTFTITKTGSSILVGRFTMVSLGIANKGEVLAKEMAEVEKHGVFHVEQKEVVKVEEEEEPPSVIHFVAASKKVINLVSLIRKEDDQPEESFWERKLRESIEEEERDKATIEAAEKRARELERTVEQAKEFYMAFRRKEVERKVSALRIVQNELALLSNLKFEVISKYHGTFKGGHGKNLDKLLRRINENEPEENQVTEEELKIYIKYCPICQKMSEKKKSETDYHPKMDTLDPAVCYADVLELGGGTDLNILVVFNALTRKACWEIIKSQTREDVAAGVILINSRQMKISELQWKSDKQPAFTSDEIQNLLKGLGMEIKFGIPASHQDQSPVERSFREIRRHIVPIIASIADTYQGNYLEIAVAIAFDIYNNMESIVGFSPNEAYSPLFYNPRIRQYLAESNLENIRGEEILTKIVEIQDKIIKEIQDRQLSIFKKKEAKNEGAASPIDIKIDGHVLLIPEDYDKHEFRKSGPWQVLDIVQSPETQQWMVHLRDPVEQVNDFAVHISRAVNYRHDPRFGDIKSIRGKDIKETVVIRIESHICIGDKKRMADYDFQCLWANGIKSYIPYSEASKLWMFDAYIQNHAEFAKVYKERQSRRSKRQETPPSIPALRRRNVQQVYHYIEGRPMEAPGHNSTPVEPPVVELSVEEVIEIITSKFQLTDEERKEVIAWFDDLLRNQKNGAYQNIFQPLKPGEFINTAKVKLRMDPDVEQRSPPPYPIKDPRAVEAYLTYIKKLILEGRARQLPPGSEVPINNPPRMVIDYYLEDGSIKWRFTQDARMRNMATQKKPFFSRQSVGELLQRMNYRIKGICDIKAAFYQLELDEESRIWTRWICPVTGHIYEMMALDMGGCNSPSELQDRMDTIFGLIAPYMDDLMNSHETIDEHKAWIVKILDLCLQYNIKLAPQKCNFFQSKVEVLGRLVDNEVHTLTEETKEKIRTMHRPKKVKDLQTFIGTENWARDYLFYKGKFISQHTKPLTEMINENPSRLHWTQERLDAFDSIKEAVANCLKLHFFDPNRKINIATDASKKGWGGIAFYLREDGTKEIFAVASGSYDETEQKWSTNEHEAKAIHNTLLAFKPYLLGREFNLFTDNRNLTFLHNNKADKVHRWACDFAQFSFKAYHIPGAFNWETDYLSRILTEKNDPTVVRFFDGHTK